MTAMRQSGYVLVTVLAFLALAMLLAGHLDTVASRYREQVADWQQWSVTQAQLASARDELLLVMLTRQLSAWGFGLGPQALRVDGRSYRLPSGILASVQDERGLISLNTPNPAILRNLLVRQGVPSTETEALLDTLADFTDLDSFHRINGAEASAYQSARLPPPANDWLASPFELRRILRWRDYPRLYTRASDWFTVGRDAWINVNSAPREVLSALPGATEPAVKLLLQRRELAPFESASDLAAVAGIAIPQYEPFWFYPGMLYHVRLWSPAGFSALELHIMLTPSGRSEPVRILEARSVTRPKQDDGKPVFPLPSLPPVARQSG